MSLGTSILKVMSAPETTGHSITEILQELRTTPDAPAADPVTRLLTSLATMVRHGFVVPVASWMEDGKKVLASDKIAAETRWRITERGRGTL